ncbi:MAG: hypothetical protein IKU34_03515 [Clostridia bacterium]|nr:hypothetical protein [Clostridia bacterium]
MMKDKRIVRDVLSIEGVRILAMLGMLIGAMLLFLPCILVGIDHPDSLAAAAGGEVIVCLALYVILKKKGMMAQNPFSVAPLLRFGGLIAITAAAYVLRCVFWMIAGGTVGIEYNTRSLGGYLLFAFLFSVMNGLCLDVFGIQHLQRRGYTEREIVIAFVCLDLLYGILDVFLRPTGTGMLANPAVWMTLLAAGIEYALMVLLFIRSRSILGRVLISFLNLVITPFGQRYTLGLWLVDVLFCACLALALFKLIRTGGKEKTA